MARKVDWICPIVLLKQIVKRWKAISHLRRPALFHVHLDSASSSFAPRRIPSGFLAVYVGAERRRLVIPTGFLKLPVFVALLKKAEEEYGFQTSGGLILPCEVGFFEWVFKILDKDEQRFGGWELDDFLKLCSELSYGS